MQICSLLIMSPSRFSLRAKMSILFELINTLVSSRVGRRILMFKLAVLRPCLWVILSLRSISVFNGMLIWLPLSEAFEAGSFVHGPISKSLWTKGITVELFPLLSEIVFIGVVLYDSWKIARWVLHTNYCRHTLPGQHLNTWRKVDIIFLCDHMPYIYLFSRAHLVRQCRDQKSFTLFWA